MTFRDIAAITGGDLLQEGPDCEIRQLVYDSRRPVIEPESSLFFAITGENHDGHDYLEDLYARGVRHFIVERSLDSSTLTGAMLLKVNNSIHALQQIAAAHRSGFQGDVVGITGSNGKTIVKEWLYQLLAPHRNVVKSPSSYNSQIGVPLSVWELDEAHGTGIFEAGISKPGEMEHLQKVIQPTFGIFTNIGSAHDQGFGSREEKIREKLKLFTSIRTLVYCRDQEEIHSQVRVPSLTWGRHPDSVIRILSEENSEGRTTFRCIQDGEEFTLALPFMDSASLENAMHAAVCMRALGFPVDVIQEGLQRLRPLGMRLELKQGIQGSYLIDDTYNNDLAGLHIALDFLANIGQKRKKSLILSDILQTGMPENELIRAVNTLMVSAGIDHFIGIGPVFSRNREEVTIPGTYYETTDQFLLDDPGDKFRDEVVLIKGARRFRFEEIVSRLEEKVHGTVLEVDLGALTHNLNYFRSKLDQDVKVMVMVKAFAYGAGSLEVANLLQYHRVDYLGVAYADEGIFLRRNGIRLPVMVMNPAPESFESMLTYGLEPEIYSLGLLRQLITFLKGREIGIHLKLDTGMHRLGFEEGELMEAKELLQAHPEISVKSMFSHLAASETDAHEAFTREQAGKFDKMSSTLDDLPGNKPIRHLLNSSGIIRYPDLQFDMVRLGIGLYGIEGNQWEQDRLQQISTLKTVVSQVKEVMPGESVGYGRAAIVDKPTRIATLAIGYADGYSRVLSKGRGKVIINGREVPVIGNVCMDMTMVDVTGVEVKEGDPVEIFGPNLPLQKLAEMSGTIPYEILTNVSQRVKRIFYSD